MNGGKSADCIENITVHKIVHEKYMERGNSIYECLPEIHWARFLLVLFRASTY